MKKTMSLLLTLLLIIGLSGCDFFKQPLIGNKPKDSEFLKSLNPTLSHQGGFYHDSIDLIITAKPNTVVYVTFDSSTPNKDSMLYQGPIRLEERYIQADGSEIIINEDSIPTYPISMIRTTSSRWVSPRKDIFNPHVVKVVAYDLLGNRSEVLTNTYFIHENMESKYTLPIISISTDINHLYDFYEGINVPGVNFDTSIEQERSNRTGNYFMRGDEWEKPIFIEYYDPSGMLAFAQNAGIRIHGGLSRKYPIKSYRLYARAEYDKKNAFDYQFFNDLDQDSFKRLILRGFGQTYEYTVFGEAAAHEVLKPLNLDIQYSSPIILFMNGEYFGIRNLRQRLDEFYLQEKYNVNRSDLTMLAGHGFLDGGSAIGSAQYVAMYNYITTKDMTKSEHYQFAKEQMDVENFIDYYISQLYFVNMDWPQNNVLYWKKNVRYNPNAPYGHDGRWRWMVFDIDGGFGASWGGNRPEMNSFDRMTGDSWKTGKLFISLLQNEEFKSQFVYRLLELSKTVFHPSVTRKIILDMKLIYQPEMQEHIDRWGFPHSMNTWDYYVNKMLFFAENRNTHFVLHLEDFLGLEEKRNMSITFDPSKGALKINEHVFQNGSISIDAYQNLYSIIEAVPKSGYHLSHYEDQHGNILSRNKKLLIYPDEEIEIHAVFKVGNERIPLILPQEFYDALRITLLLSSLIGIDYLFMITNRKKINQSKKFKM
jgi:hypothetical protein